MVNNRLIRFFLLCSMNIICLFAFPISKATNETECSATLEYTHAPGLTELQKASCPYCPHCVYQKPTYITYLKVAGLGLATQLIFKASINFIEKTMLNSLKHKTFAQNTAFGIFTLFIITGRITSHYIITQIMQKNYCWQTITADIIGAGIGEAIFRYILHSPSVKEPL